MDFVVHFHGWKNSVAGTLRGFQLIEQFVASGKNAVLVVPEGPHNAPDSSGGKLEDPEGLKKFMDEVIATLHQRAGFTRKKFTVGRIILSGHSGGYRVIASIRDRACGRTKPGICPFRHRARRKARLPSRLPAIRPGREWRR